MWTYIRSSCLDIVTPQNPHHLMSRFILPVWPSLFSCSQKHFLLRDRHPCALFHFVCQAWPVYVNLRVQCVAFFKALSSNSLFTLHRESCNVRAVMHRAGWCWYRQWTSYLSVCVTQRCCCLWQICYMWHRKRVRCDRKKKKKKEKNREAEKAAAVHVHSDML